MLNRAQERLVLYDKERPGSGVLQALKRRPDQRVAAAQVVIEEVERRTQREGVEPQTDLRQRHGHRVEIDAVDAALEDVPLEQVDVGQFFVIERDALLAEGLDDARAGAVQGEVHRVDGKQG